MSGIDDLSEKSPSLVNGGYNGISMLLAIPLVLILICSYHACLAAKKSCCLFFRMRCAGNGGELETKLVR